MMLLGALLSHLVVCGALLRPNKKLNIQINDYEIISEDVSADETSPVDYGCRCILTSIKDLFKTDMFTSPGYWLVVLVTIVTTVAATAWVVYFAPNVNQSKHFSLADAAIFVSIFGVGKIVGNLAACFFDSCQVVSTNAWMGLVVIGSCACFLIDPLLNSYWPIMVYAFIYGCFHSCTYTLLDVLTKKSVGAEQLGSALGWIGLKAGLVRALFVFFPGLIYDIYGSYTLAFILLAVINALALPALLALAWRQR
ncbi:monocarboxylate transporter 12-like [Patiria miniata]|nr:monocarboxylate transporter 12-like [Patiria miniata]